jgi:hypothetical protein
VARAAAVGGWLLSSNDPTPCRPIILCEYSHSMNNSTGNLHVYWDLFDTHPRCDLSATHALTSLAWRVCVLAVLCFVCSCRVASLGLGWRLMLWSASLR